jgi:magnesium chelatase subunit H
MWRPCPGPRQPKATVGLLMLRSYILASDTAHYDAVIRAFEAQRRPLHPGLRGRARRAARDRAVLRGAHRRDGVADGLLARRRARLQRHDAAVEALSALDVPYVAAHPLEFQTLGQWASSGQGLGPVETTMLIALPEIDGATNPTVFAGRHGEAGCDGCAHACALQDRLHEGHGALPRADREPREKTARLALLRRKRNAEKKVAVVLFGFPPNAGAVGTAGYLAVFESLFNTLTRMKAEGYTVEVPESVDALRAAILDGNARTYGQEANVAAHVDADTMVRNTRHLAAIEAVWGPAPGKLQSDGRGVFVLGQQMGNVFVGVQPGFGWEGDPMRLLFEKGFAPTHAFVQFYLWLRNTFAADVVLHFGMHGALEFMPGKQAGLGRARLARPADRRDAERLSLRLQQPLRGDAGQAPLERGDGDASDAAAGGLGALQGPAGAEGQPDALARARSDGARAGGTGGRLIDLQAAAVDLGGERDPDRLWLTLLETESALIPEGLHVVGRPMDAAMIAQHLEVLADQAPETRARVAAALALDAELRRADARALGPLRGAGAGGRPDPVAACGAGRAQHPRLRSVPDAHGLRHGRRGAAGALLLDTHVTVPRSVALVLWGSDNIKSDGVPIAQALALMGAVPRFDAYGRLSGADLIPLGDLGRPRIDVVMTLSGIFRDLLPLQTKMLAEAAWKAATADEPHEMNFVRAHSLAHARRWAAIWRRRRCASSRTPKAPTGRTSTVLVDSSAFGEEDELADAFEARKSFAYGRNGKAQANAPLLQRALKEVDVAYQNLESVELGVTTVDHYFDTLGGIARAVKRARGGEDAAIYIGDQTRGAAKVRTLKEQVALETRTRSLNPKWFEGMLKHGHEGVRQIEAQLTNTWAGRRRRGRSSPGSTSG